MISDAGRIHGDPLEFLHTAEFHGCISAEALTTKRKKRKREFVASHFWWQIEWSNQFFVRISLFCLFLVKPLGHCHIYFPPWPKGKVETVCGCVVTRGVRE